MIQVICDSRSNTARQLQAALDEVEGEGYVNRTGARLHPDEFPPEWEVLNRNSRTDKLAQMRD